MKTFRDFIHTRPNTVKVAKRHSKVANKIAEKNYSGLYTNPKIGVYTFNNSIHFESFLDDLSDKLIPGN